MIREFINSRSISTATAIILFFWSFSFIQSSDSRASSPLKGSLSEEAREVGPPVSETSPPPYHPLLDYSKMSYVELVQKLDSPEPKERESAAYYLESRLMWARNLGDLRRTFFELKEAIRREKDKNVREVMWVSIRRLFQGKKDTASAELFHEEKHYWLSLLANSDDPRIICGVLSLVIDRQAHWASKAVVEALSFPDDRVRIEACKAIRSLRVSDTQPTLLALMRKPNETGSVPWACALALAKVGDANALPALVRRCDQVKTSGHSTLDYDLAIDWIRIRTEPDQTKREQNLITVASKKHRYQIDAIEILGEMRSRKAIPNLILLLNKETFWKARFKAMEVLVFIGHQLQNEHQDGIHRVKILEALGGIVFGDDYWYVKKHAVKVLATFDCEDVVPIFKYALKEAPQGEGIHEIINQWFVEHPNLSK